MREAARMRRSTFVAGSAAAACCAPRIAAAAPSAPFIGRSAVPLVRARAGNRDLLLAVDTGDAVSSISHEAATALGLTLAPVAGGSDARTVLRGVSLAGQTLRDHPAVVTDVANWTALAGTAVDGSLGYEAFRDRTITLDYGKRRLIFPDLMPDGERATITWLKYRSQSPELITFNDLNVDGFPAVAQFDTAMTKSAIIFPTKLPDLIILPEPRAPAYSYEGGAVEPGRIGSLRLGTTLLAARPLVYAAGTGAHVPETEIAAVVGDELFARRAVTLDFPSSVLIVSDSP